MNGGLTVDVTVGRGDFDVTAALSASAGETIAAARALVDFLEEAGEVDAERAAAMRARLDEIEPELPAALADTSRYGMAKSMFSAIDADSLEKGTNLSISLSDAVPSGRAGGVPPL